MSHYNVKSFMPAEKVKHQSDETQKSNGSVNGMERY